jgi:hypothetical protein
MWHCANRGREWRLRMRHRSGKVCFRTLRCGRIEWWGSMHRGRTRRHPVGWGNMAPGRLPGLRRKTRMVLCDRHPRHSEIRAAGRDSRRWVQMTWQPNLGQFTSRCTGAAG